MQIQFGICSAFRIYNWRKVVDDLGLVIVDERAAGGRPAGGAGQVIGRVQSAAFRAGVAHNHLLKPGLKAGLQNAILIGKHLTAVGALCLKATRGR